MNYSIEIILVSRHGKMPELHLLEMSTRTLEPRKFPEQARTVGTPTTRHPPIPWGGCNQWSVSASGFAVTCHADEGKPCAECPFICIVEIRDRRSCGERRVY